MKFPQYLLFIALGLAFLSSCSVFEPESKKGSIIIQFDESQENVTDLDETLLSVRCILKRGDKSIQNEIYEKTESPFQIEITELKEAKDYSLQLYGRNVFGCITSQDQHSSIEVVGGQATTVQIEWEDNLECGPPDGVGTRRSHADFLVGQLSSFKVELKYLNRDAVRVSEEHRDSVRLRFRVCLDSIAVGAVFDIV